MKGRKATPAPIRMLRSSGVKAERLLQRQIPAPGALADPPEWFTAEQKKEWAYIIENAPRDVLRRVDKGVLAAFIIAQDLHHRASVAVQQTSLIVTNTTAKGATGVPVPNPYLNILSKQSLVMLRAAAELGFTPCSRARIELHTDAAPRCGDWEDVS